MNEDQAKANVESLRTLIYKFCYITVPLVLVCEKLYKVKQLLSKLMFYCVGILSSTRVTKGKENNQIFLALKVSNPT